MFGGQPAPQLSKAKCLTIITRRTKLEVTAIILSLKQVILYQYIFDSIVYMCSFHDVPSKCGNYFTAPFLSPNSSSFPLHSHTGWITDMSVGSAGVQSLLLPSARTPPPWSPWYSPAQIKTHGRSVNTSRTETGQQSTPNLNTVTRNGYLYSVYLLNQTIV